MSFCDSPTKQSVHLNAHMLPVLLLLLQCALLRLVCTQPGGCGMWQAGCILRDWLWRLLGRRSRCGGNLMWLVPSHVGLFILWSGSGAERHPLQHLAVGSRPIPVDHAGMHAKRLRSKVAGALTAGCVVVCCGVWFEVCCGIRHLHRSSWCIQQRCLTSCGHLVGSRRTHTYILYSLPGLSPAGDARTHMSLLPLVLQRMCVNGHGGGAVTA
jgi:hypothetical protein